MTYDATSSRVGIRRPTLDDCDEFIALIQASRTLHGPWVNLPDTRERFEAFIRSRASRITEDAFVICDVATGAIAGDVNINCIVRGHFHSAYLGYAIGETYAGRGYMTEGLRLVIEYAFTEMKLHRLEANVQPDNLPSLAVVRKCGFKKEGFSPRYLNINGQWRDHERWAILADD
jgi:[ribosomal protein S5]-alanine N-acetyltransferase